MKLLALAGAIFLALMVPALSAEACRFDYDTTLKNDVAANGFPYQEVSADKLAAFVAELEAVVGKFGGPVTRAFIANLNGRVVVGVEVNGCLLPQIPLGTAPAPATSHLSGRVGALTYA